MLKRRFQVKESLSMQPFVVLKQENCGYVGGLINSSRNRIPSVQIEL